MNAATLIARSLHTGKPEYCGFDGKDRRLYDDVMARATSIYATDPCRTEFRGFGWTVVLYERQRRQA
jgi:hypothetical protein